ncbi:hypothetical protein DPMN_066582 [Dreissena polymorpha]|uniref:Uncharacterized protein n=1 Tax=Dreissena polymorpha TaxID=45954 RepID=A0A9D3YY59_DREPO|nr:hypothetical protein DPMN_066582 [Dreissena polymorpha]
MAFSQLRYQSGALPGKKRKQPTDPVSSKRAYEVKRVPENSEYEDDDDDDDDEDMEMSVDHAFSVVLKNE